MAKLRPLVPVTLGVLIGSALLFLLLRGFRDETGVPDTTSTVGVVTSDPDPRPSSDDPDGPMRADGSSTDGSDANGAEPLSIPRTLRGIVLDDTGRAIDGARIVVKPVPPQVLRGAPYPDGPTLAETQSERDGRFELPADHAGWMRLTASADGHATVGRLVAGTGAELRLVLPPSGVLTLTVLDARGRPVPDARVEARLDQTTLTVASNADGMAIFEHAPPGDALVRAGADGHGTVRAGPFRVRAGETTAADVALTAGVELRGVVRDDETGAPLRGATVWVARPGASTDAGPTDEKGRFRAPVAGGLGERVFVSVDHAGYASVLVPVILRPLDAGPQTTEVRLRPADPWRGEVLFPTGVEPRPVTVRYTENGVAGRTSASTTTDADGRFELPPPPPAAPGRRIVLVAETDGLKAALALRPGQLRPSPLMLALTPAATVRGRIRAADGAAASGAIVRLVPTWTREGPRGLTPAENLLRASNEAGLADLTAATDADGRFRLQGVPDSTYEVFVAWGGREYWTGREVEVSGDSDAGTIGLAGIASVEGRVRDATGADLAGARVRLVREGERPRVLSQLTASDGSFRFDGLLAGRYALRVSLSGYADLEVELEPLSADAAGPEPLDLRMNAAAVLEGRLRVDGAPYRGTFRLTLHRAGTSRAERTPVTLRTSDGRFTLPGIPSGAWTVRVTTADGDLGLLTDSLEARPGDVLRAEIDLMPGAVLEGRVKTSAGDAVPAARVSLRDEASGVRHLATAMADGRYRFEGLAAGTYAMRVTGHGGVPVEQQVVLDLADRETFDPVLPVGGHARVQVVDANGRRMSGVLLLFRNADGVYPATPPDRTDRDGIALRRHLPAGSMTVRARIGTLEGIASFIVAEGTISDVRVELVPRGG
ncbi:MAG: carboxypeptidase regulatory-like domain-containing protein [Planctomycetota bacterium]|nr:carboxypeptidase regulatory-like domain-containing protein [Planctomycetota bacterium]